MEFTKMNGAGNDFVITDNRTVKANYSQKTIANLCDRNRGIGADGFMSVETAERDGDYKMRYYNADGGEAEMCGNGARCFARFVYDCDGEINPSMNIETVAGIISAEIKNNLVQIKLSQPFDLKLNQEIKIDDSNKTIHSMNTGVPHAVLIEDELSQVDIKVLGSIVRNHTLFSPDGTNVNFVQINKSDTLTIRTYERGVEDETLACGTGMVASALIHHQLNGINPPAYVTVKGGDTLEVSWHYNNNQYSNVTLKGPAISVFTGKIHV
tara:strand:- start:460 stop:1263 length:804 start_codon:yes stop_codon:yes gene_type:complete